MPHAVHTDVATGSQITLQPVIDWSAQVLEAMLRVQQLQLGALAVQSEFVRVTQAQAAASASALWDEWVAHWGGGVPLDG